jgi:alpha-tubulin suppressor-like RCC1 family protein
MKGRRGRAWTGRCAVFLVFAVLVAAATAPLASTAAAGASSAGQLYAFGSNKYGQLASTTNNGTLNPNPTPTPVSLPGATGPVVQIAAGGYHSLVLTASGQLYAFGENRFGQLGSAVNNGTSNANPTPTPISLPGATGPVVQIAAGSSHSLVLTASGQLYAFGENRFGQLGSATSNGTEDPNPNPTPVSLPGATGPVVQIAAGQLHSLALTASGQLYAFGYNRYGQLGSATNNGTNNPNPNPTPVTLPGATGPIMQIDAGSFYSLALTASGQLYAFGHNRYGQLGSATNNGTDKANPSPMPVTLPGETGPVVQIGADVSDSLAVTAAGQLYSFGNNFYGQLGSATNNGTENANPTPTHVSLPGATGPVVQIGAGDSDSLAVTAAGQLYAFGNNFYGQLGIATNSGALNPNPTPTPVSLPGGVTVDTVASGWTHSLAVIADLSIASTSLPGGTAGIPYRAQLEASGGTAPYRWSAIGLPAGLAIDAASGEISGVPERPADSGVTVTVTDRHGIVATKTLALAVAASFSSAPPSSAPPRLSRLAVSPRRLSLAGRLVGGGCKPLAASNRRKPPCRQKLRLRVGFELNSPATVTVRFARLSVGRQLLSGCAKATEANDKRRRCTRATPLGNPIDRQAVAGADTLAITRPTLVPGRYRLTATPSTPGREGVPQSTSLMITG